MDRLEAKLILDSYQSLIRDLRPQAIAQSNATLRRTPATIRYAHFVYGENLVEEGALTNDGLQALMESYGLLESYFVDDPEPINQRYREHVVKLHRGVITEFQIPNPFGEPNKVLEYHNFIGDCFFRFRRGALKNSTLGAFIFEAIRSKLWRKKTQKHLSNWRAVELPGR